MPAPPGWYKDPADATQLRWWDEAGWSDRTRPAPVADDSSLAVSAPIGISAWQPPAPEAARAARIARSKEAGNSLSNLGLTLSLAALLIVPILLAPAGVTLGVLGRRKGERRSYYTIATGVATFIAGIALSVYTVTKPLHHH